MAKAGEYCGYSGAVIYFLAKNLSLIVLC